MLDGYDSFEMADFRGGMNVSVSPFSVSDREVVDALNVVLDKTGAFTKRNGFKKENATDIVHSGGQGIDILVKYYAKTTSYFIAIVKAPTEYAMYVKSDTTWTQITGGSQLMPYPTRIMAFDGVVFIYNGYQFQRWTPGASTKSDVTFFADPAYESSLTPDLMVAHGNRLWLRNNATNEEGLLYFSDLNGWNGSDEMLFQVGHSIKLPTASRGRTITNIFDYAAEDALYSFTAYEIWRVGGIDENDFAYTKVYSGAGCVSPDGVCETERGTLDFIGGAGNVYEIAGGNIAIISKNIRNLLQGSDMSAAQIAYDDARDALYVTFNGGLVVWNTETKGWTRFASTMAFDNLVISVNESGKVCFAPKNGLAVYTLFVGETDAAAFDGTGGVSINWQIVHKPLTLGSVKLEKRWRGIQLVADVSAEQPCSYRFKTNWGYVNFSDDNISNSVNFRTQGAKFDVDSWDACSFADNSMRLGYAVLPETDKLPGNRGHWAQVTLYGDDSRDITIFSTMVFYKIMPLLLEYPAA